MSLKVDSEAADELPGFAKPSVRKALVDAAGRNGVSACADILTVRMDGVELMDLLDRSGASREVVNEGAEWGLIHSPSRLSPHGTYAALGGNCLRRFVPSAALVKFTFSGESFLAAIHRGGAEGNVPLVSFVGSSHDAIARLAARLDARPPGRVAIVHGGIGGTSQRVVPPVSEEALVLAPGIAQRLLPDLDAYWKHAGEAAARGVRPSRGVMLVGLPGTGKTQLVRHILSRYPHVDAHICMEGQGFRSGFESMVDWIEQASRPAIAVIEDIDRLLESRSIPRQLLLAVLDGLRELGAPILWLATTNDPLQVESALLDRPGRFDDVVRIELPGQEGRERMFGLWSPGDASDSELSSWARLAEGLTGAHIRIACEKARMATWESPREFASALPRYIADLRKLHEGAAGLRSPLDESRVGFGPSPIAGR